MPKRMKLLDALKALNHNEDAHWTKDGKPDLNAVTEKTGRRITRVMVLRVAPELNRKIIEVAVSEDPPETDDSGHGIHALCAAFKALTTEEIRTNTSLIQVVSAFNHHHDSMMQHHRRNCIKGRV